MSFSDWSTTADSNGTTLGVNITEGATPVQNVNNAIRKVMADLRAGFSTSLASFFAGTAPLPVASGGTGGTTASAGRTALGAAASGANSDITSLTGLTTALAVARGGTGATTAAAALAALGGIGITASDLTSNPGYIHFSNGFKLQWGRNSVAGNTSTTQNYAIPFTTTAGFVVSSYATPGLSDGDNVSAYNSGSLSAVGLANGQASSFTINWLAGGV